MSVIVVCSACRREHLGGPRIEANWTCDSCAGRSPRSCDCTDYLTSIDGPADG